MDGNLLNHVHTLAMRYTRQVHPTTLFCHAKEHRITEQPISPEHPLLIWIKTCNLLLMLKDRPTLIVKQFAVALYEKFDLINLEQFTPCWKLVAIIS